MVEAVTVAAVATVAGMVAGMVADMADLMVTHMEAVVAAAQRSSSRSSWKMDPSTEAMGVKGAEAAATAMDMAMRADTNMAPIMEENRCSK